MRRTTRLGIATGLITLGAMFVLPELALRLHHGELFSFESTLRRHRPRTDMPLAEYHATLGWVPRSGSFELVPGQDFRVSDSGLRSPGRDSVPRGAGASILALGDSFTFGDEVRDHETWPAQLEARTGRPVLNGGVFAYGVDQAFLRGRALLQEHEVDVVLLALISDDVNRTEFSYYQGWKPYFEWVDRELVLRNVPVPSEGSPQPRFGVLREALGYSLLARAVLKRLAPGWWYYGWIAQAHGDGVRVTVELLRQMDDLARLEGARFVAITLGTNGRIGDDTRLPEVVERARGSGVDVLDLAPQVAALRESGGEDLFREHGHYSPSLNGWVAARIAEHLGSEPR